MGIITAQLGPYTLTFDCSAGTWLSLSKDGVAVLDGGNGLPEISLLTGGVTIVATGRGHLDNIRNLVPVGADFRLKSHTADDERITLTLEENGWRVVETFRCNHSKDRLERSATIEWIGEGERLLRFALLNMPIFSPGHLDTLEMPGYNGVLHQSIEKLPIGRYPLAPDGADVDGANWRPGVLAVGGQGSSLVTWAFAEDMPAIWQVYNGKHGAWAEQKWVCCCRMTKGVMIEVGTQYLTVSDKPILDALDCIRPFWTDVGLVPKQPAEDWGKTAFIYEAQIGPKGSRGGKSHNPYPTPAALKDDLSRIQDLGFTVIELMPHFPFPSYSVSDYFDISVCYGEQTELKEMIHAAHAMGIRVFLDVVMHGVSDQTIRRDAPHKRHPLLDEHPEFFIETEDGRVARTYTWSFDQADPSLRAYIQKVFCHYVKELDADGFRVDALTWNYFPNWRKGLAYPAYKSIDGCFGLFEQVRDAVWEIKPGVVFYSETTGPLMARSFDLSYCYDEVWLYENLCPLPAWAQNLGNWNKLPAAKPIHAKDAAQWLALRQKVLPQNWVKVHHADSHDTYEWGGLGVFRRESMGIAPTRALFAYCCFVEGAVMNYAGGEYGSEEAYRYLIRARKSHPALLMGTCDYTAIHADNDNLFFVLRKKDDLVALPVINFSEEAANTRVSLCNVGLPVNCAWTLKEYFTGKQILLSAEDAKELPLEIGAYGYQLWEIFT